MEHTNIPVIAKFNTWKDFTTFLSEQGIGKAFAGVGIFHNKEGNTLLRSVDGTDYYKDEDNKYTLYGQYGDQVLTDKYNKPFLDKRTGYLYRVTTAKPKYLWYGRVHINGDLEHLQHVGRDGRMRTIYRAPLVSLRLL